MNTYTYCLVSHIAGIVLLSIAGIISFQHAYWFCTIACLLSVSIICISLYRIQMRQTDMMRSIVEGMKRYDLNQTTRAPFKNKTMEKLAEDMSQALGDLRRKILDEEVKHQYYENLLNKVDTAVIVTDKQGHADWMNQAALQLFGENRQLPEEILKALKENKQIVRLTKQQTTLDLAIASTLILLRGQDRWIVSLKNIHSALEYTEMEAWQKLIRVLTHEIMNSITPIISLSETLSERSKEAPADERIQKHIQQGLQVIYRRSKGLLEFVENYRRLTRIAPPAKTTINVYQFFEDLQRLYPGPQYYFSMPDKNIAWQADRPQMEQVFINLLKNADEACGNTEQPRIEISAFSSPGSLTFTITDNGEGMLPEVTERIFVPFFTTKSSGSGIGLSLCKQIVTLHKGQITVQSEAGKGSRFTIIFPTP